MEVLSQFHNLDIKQAHQWPVLPKYTLLTALAAVILTAGWYAYVSDKSLNLEASLQQEALHKTTFQDKYSKVQSLEGLRQQKMLVAEQVKSLEGLLPNKTEMDKLLADINQLGIKHNLSFQLFKPGDPELQEYYARIPLDVKIKGKYHDVAGFISDVANLSRIVNSNKLQLSEQAISSVDKKMGGQDKLILEGILNTYRLLDESEKKAAQEKIRQIKASQMQQDADGGMKTKGI